MINTGLRRLTRDVPNPTYDRRTRYGDKSVAVYEAGTVFEYSPGKVEHFGGNTYTDAPTVRLHDYYVHTSKLAHALVEASEPHTPTTWAEVVLEKGYSNPANFAIDAIEMMIAQGLLSIDRARAIVQSILDAPASNV